MFRNHLLPSAPGQNRAALLTNVRKGTVENLSMAEMARLAGIEKADDDAAWNKKYLKGADAQKAIAAAFEAEMSGPPAQPKSAPPPAPQTSAPFQWDASTLSQVSTFLNDRFQLTIAVAQDMVGKAVHEFATLHDFTLAIWQEVFNRQTPFYVSKIHYHPGSNGSQGWSTFPEVPLPAKMWGSSDKLKALEGECASEAFLTALKSGQEQRLPKGVKVLHKPAGEGAKDRSQQVVKLEIDIPF